MNERFIYIFEDIQPKNISSKLLRKVGNKYDMKSIAHIEIKNLNDGDVKFLILFTINNDIDNYLSKTKEIYFTNDEAFNFDKIFRFYLKLNKIPILDHYK